MVQLTILNQDTAQFAALPILLANMCLICSYFSTQAIPWVRARITIAESYFSLNIPIDVGLWQCFSAICDEYKDVIYHTDTLSNIHSISDGHSTSYSTTNVNIPTKKLPVVHAPTKTMQDIMDTQIRQSIDVIKQPYIDASRICIPLLSISSCICLVSVFISIYFVFVRKRMYYKNQLTILLFSLTLNAGAIVAYVYITLPHINGGQYLDGMWITIATNILGVFLSIISILILDDSFCCKSYSIESEDYASANELAALKLGSSFSNHGEFHNRRFGNLVSDNCENSNSNTADIMLPQSHFYQHQYGSFSDSGWANNDSMRSDRTDGHVAESPDDAFGWIPRCDSMQLLDGHKKSKTSASTAKHNSSPSTNGKYVQAPPPRSSRQMESLQEGGLNV